MGLGPSNSAQPDCEKWGLPWDGYAPRYDRLFEMHPRDMWQKRGEAYLERLRILDIEIYMQRIHDDIPMSRVYPLPWVSGLVGDYYGSSAAYMLALAIADGHNEIGLYGFELHEKDGYDHQRPNLEYMIGFARGQGAKVTVAEGSDLLTHRPEHNFQGESVIYPQRYGYL